ncbi:MAG: hypothetical protein ABSF92_00620 [Candidatus Acidiferrales bacterium]|jgi:hypothetical protein
MKKTADPQRGLLRHTVATLAYRAGKALRGAPDSFANYRAGDSGRTSGEILAHMGDLFNWALSMACGKPAWHDSNPQAWPKEVERFFAALRAFDDYLASAKALHVSVEQLFQGPIADALTHVGQLAMLRRLAAAPIRGENYYLAEIVEGRVGPDQAPPRREFD